jgi:hypothetical protein
MGRHPGPFCMKNPAAERAGGFSSSGTGYGLIPRGRIRGPGARRTFDSCRRVYGPGSVAVRQPSEGDVIRTASGSSYAAAYGNATQALADLDAIEQLHKDEVIGSYDAAVIDKENGKPYMVKRMDRPRIRIIPEVFGSGTLPRKELHEAAEALTANEAGLIAVGDKTIEKALDNAIADAAKVTKRFVDAATDEIADELREALNG